MAASSVSVSSKTKSMLASSSSASACSSMRGNPSKMMPLLLFVCCIFFLMSLRVMSIGTSSPLARMCLIFFPCSVLLRASSRSMSPTAIMQSSYFFAIFAVCVPLPEPGGPMRMMFMGLCWCCCYFKIFYALVV